MNEIVTVYSAEMMRRLRSRAFILGLAIGALAIGVMIQFPNFMQSIYTNHTNRIVLAGDPALLPRAKALLEKDFKVVATSSSAATPTANDLKAHRASAYFILAATPSGLKVTAYARDPGDVSASQLRRLLLPLSIESAARISAHRAESIVRIPVRIHPISSKFASAQQSNAARGIAYILLLLLYLLIIINSQIIMSSVAEEKTSRIAELL
ncbi:MAG: ABC transporter permease family protein, partial [Vulcanimicrobiaceae bacterium]